MEPRHMQPRPPRILPDLDARLAAAGITVEDLDAVKAEVDARPTEQVAWEAPDGRRYPRCDGCAQPIVDQAEHNKVCGWAGIKGGHR